MSITNFLEINRKRVRDACGRDEKDALKHIETLRNWCKTQPHLPEIPSDNMIETYLVVNDFDIETTKKSLDMYYTVRSLVPDIFEHSNPQLPEMQIVPDEIGVTVCLPKLTKELCRVHVLKLTENTESFHIYKHFANLFNVLEVRIQHDLAKGDLFLIDHQNLKMDHVEKMTPAYVKNIVLVLENIVANRLKGVHVLNYPTYVNTPFSVFKSLSSPTLSGKFQFHASIDSLYQKIPREVLPKEYGGDGPTMDELKDVWKSILKNNSDRFDKLDKMKVREDLRPTPLDRSGIVGYLENFVQAEVE